MGRLQLYGDAKKAALELAGHALNVPFWPNLRPLGRGLRSQYGRMLVEDVRAFFRGVR